jgi:hypothetical protein
MPLKLSRKSAIIAAARESTLGSIISNRREDENEIGEDLGSTGKGAQL